eukprot:548999_1
MISRNLKSFRGSAPWNIARVLFPTPRDGTQTVMRTTSTFRHHFHSRSICLDEKNENQVNETRTEIVPPSPIRVVLSNVPFEMDEAEIKKCLDTYGILRSERLLRRNGKARDRVWVWCADKNSADDLVAASKSFIPLTFIDKWDNVRLIKAGLSNDEVGAINPPRPEEEVYGTTGRMPALMKDAEYDATQGLLEGFDRVMAGDDVHRVLAEDGEEIPEETEQLFQAWERRMIEFNDDLGRQTIPDKMAESWDLPPLIIPPNLIAKRERLHIEAEEQRKQKEMERLANMGEMLSEEEMSVTEFDKPADMIPEGGEDEDHKLLPWLTGSWMDVVINTDTTQKVVNGGNIMSHRALVCTGNGKGTAGFGIGKGANEAVAVKKALRAARRDLIFVDRYKNRGILFDLQGKHNNCIVRILSRPEGFGLNAGRVMEYILKLFGITDVTCKSIGRRNPYSVVMATFNALKTHRGLQDVALARGKRIIPLHRMKLSRAHMVGRM